MASPTAVDAQAANRMLRDLPGWSLDPGDKSISKSYAFKNYYETIAFVNATAWISHRADHHPDLIVGYNTCKVTYSTHSTGGLSDLDFACAADVEALGSAR